MKISKSFVRSTSAFSVVIASLILMLLAVASGTVVYGYVMGWLGGATQTSSSQRGQLQFDSLYANTTYVSLYVRNIGSKDLTLDRIYVDGEQKTVIGTMGTLAPNAVSGKLAVANTMTKGKFYEVKVTCTDGTTISQSVEAK